MVERQEERVAGSLATLRLGYGPSNVNNTSARPSSVNSGLYEERRFMPCLLTYEGQMKVVHFLGVQPALPGAWKVEGKCWCYAGEGERKPIGKSGFIAIGQRFFTIAARFCRLCGDYGAIAQQ